MGRALLAVLGIGKGSWGHIARLISEEEWDRIIIIGNDWGKENFSPAKEVEWVIVNNRAGFNILKDAIKEKLPNEEIFVSLISGSGKEHTALLAALREAEKQFKLVILTGKGTEYF
jgi:hypothetical protein